MKNKNATSGNFAKAYEIFSNRFLTVILSIVCYSLPFYLLYIFMSDFLCFKVPLNTSFSGIEITSQQIYGVLFIIIQSVVFKPFFMSTMNFLSTTYKKDEYIKPKTTILRSLKLYKPLILTSLLFNLIVFLPTFLSALTLILSVYFYFNDMVPLCSLFSIISLLSLIPTMFFTPYFQTMFYFNPFVINSSEDKPVDILKKTYTSLNQSKMRAFLILFSVMILSLLISQTVIELILLSKIPDNYILEIFTNFILSIINSYFIIFLSLWYKDKCEETTNYKEK